MTAPVPAGPQSLVTAGGASGASEPAGPAGPAGQQAGTTGAGPQSPEPRSPEPRSPEPRSQGPDQLAPEPARPADPGPAAGSIWTRATFAGPDGTGTAGVAGTAGMDADEPFARVDVRKLEAALLGLRHPILTVPLLFESPGVAEARAERVKLLSQIDDYLLPRLRQSGAPILVALVGSTGAGKSTLMNSVVAKQVSATGIRRPTTNSHRSDASKN